MTHWPYVSGRRYLARRRPSQRSVQSVVGADSNLDRQLHLDNVAEEEDVEMQKGLRNPERDTLHEEAV